VINEINFKYNYQHLLYNLKKSSIINCFTDINNLNTKYLYILFNIIKYLLILLLWEVFFMLFFLIMNELKINNVLYLDMVFLAFSFFIAGEIPIIKLNRNDYNIINSFRYNEYKYILHLFINFLISSLFLLLSLLLTRWYHKLSIIHIILFYLLYLSIYFTMEYLKVYIYSKIKLKIIDSTYRHLLNLVNFELLILLLYLFRNILNNVIIVIIISIILILGFISILNLYYYKDYRKFYRKNLTLEYINNKKLYVKEELKSLDISEYSNINCYEYLNNIFNNRFRKSILARKNYKRNLLLFGISILLTLFLAGTYLFKNSDFVMKIKDFLIMYDNYVFIIIIFISETRRYILLNFYEIDRYLLNLKKYRTLDNIKDTYNIRYNTLKSINKTNYLICIVIEAIISILLNKNIFIIIFKLVALYLISLVYDKIILKMYYLFVPFDKNGLTKNKIYSIIENTIIILVMFPCISFIFNINILENNILLIAYYYIIIFILHILDYILKRVKVEGRFKLYEY